MCTAVSDLKVVLDQYSEGRLILEHSRPKYLYYVIFYTCILYNQSVLVCWVDIISPSQGLGYKSRTLYIYSSLGGVFVIKDDTHNLSCIFLALCKVLFTCS